MRCEGWTKHGGAFTLGPVRWAQCENEAVVMLVVKQKDKINKYPGCMNCWDKCKEFAIEIISAELIEDVELVKD